MYRTLRGISQARDAMDGAGVKIKRIAVAQNGLADPFLLLDEIHSDDPNDYIAGFPPHPHRGIETLTYIRQGGIQHEDHMGNKGEVRSGGAQWMSAGRGVIHGEMPLKEDDVLHGFQLWINLSAAHKMKQPDYRDVPKADIPDVSTEHYRAHVLAGDWCLAGQQVSGPLDQLEAQVGYLDLILPAGGEFEHSVPDGHQVVAYVYKGSALFDQPVRQHQFAMFNDTGDIRVTSEQGAHILLLHGRPHKEPVVNYGPFVMNSYEEIDQAIRDYQNGTLTNPD